LFCAKAVADDNVAPVSFSEKLPVEVVAVNIENVAGTFPEASCLGK